MEFYIIDPKDESFDTWTSKIRAFLRNQYPQFEEKQHEFYFASKNIATPWLEDVTVFEVPGEEGGVIEVRDEDQQIYMFIDQFTARNLKDNKDHLSAKHFNFHVPDIVYGFEQESLNLNRFHFGPIHHVQFMYQGQDQTFPTPYTPQKLFQTGFPAAYQMVHQQLHRLQELRKYQTEKLFSVFDVTFSFASPVLLQRLKELYKNRFWDQFDKSSASIKIENPNLDQIKELFACFPIESGAYVKFQGKLSWQAYLSNHPKNDGKNKESAVQISNLYFEKRSLKPFIQIPILRCSKIFQDKCYQEFKGYRIHRHTHQL
jgi:hypothetical protein